MKTYKQSLAILVSIVVLSGMNKGFSLEQSTEKNTNEINTKAGEWITRVRALYIDPMDSSGSLSTIPDSGVGVMPAWTGEFDISYMFTKNLGAELILGTSCHTIRGKKALSGTKIGTTWLLPPTLTLQWRFLPSYRIQPYVGGGVNYTLFYGEGCSLANTHMKLQHAWGPAAQIGFDFFLSKHWLFNCDLKYIWMQTTAHLTGGVPGSVHVHVNPLVVGFGFGYKW